MTDSGYRLLESQLCALPGVETLCASFFRLQETRERFI